MKAEEEARRKWSWYKMIKELAGNDITKVEYILGLPFIMCLTWLAEQKENER